MKKKLALVILTLLICLICIPFFSGCKAGENYTLNTDEDGNKYYTFSASGFTNSLKGEYEIPEYYGEGEDRAPVKEIAQEGLSSTGIRKLIIPKTVEKIGAAAFAYNYTLEEVVFAQDCALSEIPRGAFGYCRSVKLISLPQSVKTIEALAFLNCELLNEVVLPEGLEVIGDGSFEGCKALGKVTLPQTLIKIGDMAFYNSALTEIKIPDSVCDIEREETGEDGKPVKVIDYGLGYAAFHSCEKLIKAEVGSGVTVLRSGVFGYCTSLKEIYLSAAVKKIEGAYYIDEKLQCGHAFHNDGALTDVYFEGSKAQWESIEIAEDKVTVQGASYDNSALTRAKVHYGS